MTLQKKLLNTLLQWRTKDMNDTSFMVVISILLGIVSAVAAIILKNLVHFIMGLLTKISFWDFDNIMFLVYPIIGILLTIVIVRYLLREKLGEGVPKVLYAISRNNAILKPVSMVSAMIGSALTVGFGGSAGLEGPTIATGAAVGSNIGQALKLNYRQTALLLVCASAGAMAAIFKSPIAAIVFVIEVMMLDLTAASIVPLLISTVTATLVSYLLLGMDVIYPIEKVAAFQLNQTHFYVLLGVVAGFTSLLFTRIYRVSHNFFEKHFKSWGYSLLFGGLSLGALIFFIPSFYGEGFEAINRCLHGDFMPLYHNSFFARYGDGAGLLLLFLLASVVLKCVATNLTFGAGGLGGIFAPTLFIGSHLGLLFALTVNYYQLGDISPVTFALVGMCGCIAGVIHAPLTGIFLIAELTGGYTLFMPLMITSIISFITIRIFEKHSVYTYQLAQKGDLFTHNKDENTLRMLNMNQLIETNFSAIDFEATLGDLVDVISRSKRNIFPVVDPADNLFYGMVRFDDVRPLMFKTDLYNTTKVKNLMVTPSEIISVQDDVEEVAEKFRQNNLYNMVVLDGDKYVGFVSRANLFSEYRKKLKEFSEG
ncbi:MAG: chloride channel protein [Bacteroidales bacterium]|nr:chloride channel protein [Bacteroidales bacterium]